MFIIIVWVILFLIILGGMATVYLVFFQSKKPPTRPKHQIDSEPHIQDSIRVLPTGDVQKVQETTTLIIAVSVNYPDVINIFQSKNKLDQEDWGKIYEACQYLSQSRSLLSSVWDSRVSRFYPQEPSEYDTYLVKVDLTEKDERFNEDVNQLDRYDAFCELKDRAKNVQLSERLKIEVCNEFDFYKR